MRELIRLARELDSREGPDLAAFLAYVDARASQRDRESEAATRSEGHSGVRVMTVHAAKDLEFPVVAVADLGRDLLGRRFGRRCGWAGRGSADGASRCGSVRLGRRVGADPTSASTSYRAA